MEIKLGDYVKVEFNNVILGTDHGDKLAHLCNKRLYKYFNYKYYKGTVLNISTHTWFGLVKRKRPIYLIELHLLPDVVVGTHTIKKTIRQKNSPHS